MVERTTVSVIVTAGRYRAPGPPVAAARLAQTRRMNVFIAENREMDP
jgi:hypothetical protein